ncbi:MAG: hypothetical protein HQK77_17940 [Desulfobacterales bacterium]|nr:hypothetical protein [Desulfobacterales bacterium]
MKKKCNVGVIVFVLVISSIFLTLTALAEDDNRFHDKATAAENDRQDDDVLTDEIKSKVASILFQYNPDTLTASDAKAINNAFRESGIHRGSAQQEAIKAAGFDPQKISHLDPPPEKYRERKPEN